MIAAASTFKSAFALLETTPRRCACLSPVGQGQPVGSARFASYVRSSSGTLPPFSTSFCITCLCSQIFIDAGIVRVTAIVEFGSKLFARREARSSRLRSFIRSTIDFCQSSFSLLLAASLVRMAATSTVAAGAAPGADAGFGAADGDVPAGAAPGADAGFGAADGDVPAGAAPAPGAAPAGAVAALAWPKIVDTIFPRMLMELSHFFFKVRLLAVGFH